MFRKVDCIRIHVPDIQAGLTFYRDGLGLKLVWRRGNKEAALKMDDSDTELVLVMEKLKGEEVDFLVDSVGKAARRVEQLGGKVEVQPFDIAMGRCSVIKDPWGNKFVLVDTTKGLLKTDEEGNVVEH